jgi:hypothetical protein
LWYEFKFSFISIISDMKRASLPVDFLSTWAKFNGVLYNNVAVWTVTTGTENRGAGVVALESRYCAEGEAVNLMVVPKGLVLSLGLVEDHAKSDKHLREVLEAVGEFGRVREVLY